MKLEPGIKHKGMTKIRPKSVPQTSHMLRKPPWIRVKWQTADTHGQSSTPSKFGVVKQLLRQRQLHTVCEEASCPNIAECFSHGTASFMILGAVCTRRCSFCDVGFGRPLPPSEEEPEQLADAIAALQLRHVVITSVDRDDLTDGGATHFVRCIAAIRNASPRTDIEILVPDFRGRVDKALDILTREPPDIFNHNLETVPRLYPQTRPGANYQHSLNLLQTFKQHCPSVPTKSGIMVGLGENDDEIIGVMHDLRAHRVDMITVGQYLQPSQSHHPVLRYVEPCIFDDWQQQAKHMGFVHAAIGAMVRSSYHADQQARHLHLNT